MIMFHYFLTFWQTINQLIERIIVRFDWLEFFNHQLIRHEVTTKYYLFLIFLHTFLNYIAICWTFHQAETFLHALTWGAAHGMSSTSALCFLPGSLFIWDICFLLWLPKVCITMKSFSPYPSLSQYTDTNLRWIFPLMWIQSQTEYSSSRPWLSSWWRLVLRLYRLYSLFSAVGGLLVFSLSVIVSPGCRRLKLTSRWTPSVSTRPMAMQWKRC